MITARTGHRSVCRMLLENSVRPMPFKNAWHRYNSVYVEDQDTKRRDCKHERDKVRAREAARLRRVVDDVQGSHHGVGPKAGVDEGEQKAENRGERQRGAILSRQNNDLGVDRVPGFGGKHALQGHEPLPHLIGVGEKTEHRNDEHKGGEDRQQHVEGNARRQQADVIR